MSYDGRVHSIQFGEITRQFPLFQVAPGVKIAIFNMLGDTEAVEVAAKELTARMPANVDVLVFPEVKVIPLAHALSVHTGLPYVVVRKFRKPYMVDCLETEVTSITTGKPQNLYLDGKDRHLVEGKNVALVDDVVSTGSTLIGLRQLMSAANATITAEMAVFTEGNEADWPNIIALGNLPIFTD